MQGWEYLFVEFQIWRDIFRPRVINGQIPEWWQQAPDLAAYCQQVGAEGWEMVTFPNFAVRKNSNEAFTVVFKRPKLE